MKANEFLELYMKMGQFGFNSTVPVIVEVNGEIFQVEQVRLIPDPPEIMIVVASLNWKRR